MKIKINGNEVFAKEGETILDVANREGVKIPTLCFLKEVGATSACRVCLVEVKGFKNLISACSFKVFDGMEIETDTKRVLEARKTNVELLLSNHNFDCLNCVKNETCSLQKLVETLNANPDRFIGEKSVSKIDVSPCIVRDSSKCILCKKCVSVCEQIQGVNAICETNRGFNTKIETAFEQGFINSSCVGCGQCVNVCPTGALTENQNIKNALEILDIKYKEKICIVAPAVRVAVKEMFNLTSVEEAEKILPSLLKKVGFNKVFDVNFGADLTIVEESKEFLNRLKDGKNLPLFTSCCPSWVEYAHKFYPELKQNISSCKSPQMMMGAVIKSYYADINNVYPDNIKVVAIMPCTSKKEEILKVGEKDIDCVLTTRELEWIIKKKGVDINNVTQSGFDSLLGESSGAGVIFGATGGVMEATLRTVSDIVCEKDLKKIDYEEVRGLSGVKRASVSLLGQVVNVAVVSGLNNAKFLIEKIKKKEIDLHFVEVMACPSGCINGGGMPFKDPNDACVLEQRIAGLYNLDKSRPVRKSHQNKEVVDFLNWQKSAKHKPKLHTH